MDLCASLTIAGEITGSTAGALLNESFDGPATGAATDGAMRLTGAVTGVAAVGAATVGAATDGASRPTGAATGVAAVGAATGAATGAAMGSAIGAARLVIADTARTMPEKKCSSPIINFKWLPLIFGILSTSNLMPIGLHSSLTS